MAVVSDGMEGHRDVIWKMLWKELVGGNHG